MRTILVFIKCTLGKAYEVAADLCDRVEESGKIYSISGDFDLVAEFKLDEDQDIGRFVNEKVHAIDGISNTKTLICFNAFTRDRGIGD